MEKMNMSNKKIAFGYALYMIASSYFNDVVCDSKIIERKMLLHYREVKKEQQYDMEDICINFMDQLIKVIPERVVNQAVKIRLEYDENDVISVRIAGVDFALVFTAEYVGRRTKIKCRYISYHKDKEYLPDKSTIAA